MFMQSAEAQEAFELLKKALISLPALAHPNYWMQFEVYYDASSVGVGAVLVQEDRPVAYASRILNFSEWNYSIIESVLQLFENCISLVAILMKYK